MSDSVFPALPGIAWNITRTPTWQTRKQQSVSGRETRQADWFYPRYSWELSYDFLRSNLAFSELQTLIGFINSVQGGFDTFLYSDDDDNTATNQQIGIGDGSTTIFQFVRAFGNFIEPVGRLKTFTNVTVGGVLTGAASLIYNNGIESGSAIQFATAPASGAAIVANFTYYWRCRFTDDTNDFIKFAYQFSSLSSLKFESVK